jgi:hypothetical protein
MMNIKKGCQSCRLKFPRIEESTDFKANRRQLLTCQEVIRFSQKELRVIEHDKVFRLLGNH